MLGSLLAHGRWTLTISLVMEFFSLGLRCMDPTEPVQLGQVTILPLQPFPHTQAELVAGAGFMKQTLKYTGLGDGYAKQREHAAALPDFAARYCRARF
jgi:hypothetical protein